MEFYLYTIHFFSLEEPIAVILNIMMNTLRNRLSNWQRLLAVILIGGLTSCSGYKFEDSMPSWLGSSIYQYLDDEGHYTNLIQLINDLEYKEVLSKTGSKTLFVADDDAFNRFFAGNRWGVKKYADFSLAQKRLILNGSMINNAFQTTTLSSTEGPVEGDCMRRLTAMSIYDSVPRIMPEEMPNTSYWTKFKTRPEGLVCLKDMTPSPIIHFIENQLSMNKISNSDYNFLFNYTTDRQPGDASVNGIAIENQNIKCLNGFVHQMAEVMTPLDNMAEIIRKNPNTSEFSKLLERFSAPYYNATATTDFNRIFGTNVDSVYQKRYFSLRSQNGNFILSTPDNKPVPGQLKFDPGWNSFYSATISTVSNNVALQENMGVMLVPSNEALDRYWNQEGGKALRNYYGSWENVPYNVMAKLINNNMQNSFVGTVPSKFETVLNDASNEIGLSTELIDSVFLGCNGVVYVTNKVFSPTSYASVSFPALINESMNIFYWAIEQLEYYAYLNSMDSYYSFFIPTNKALTQYIDPVSYGQTKTKLYRFSWDTKATSITSKVKASVWNIDLTTGEKDSLGMATYGQIRDRLQDMLDYHIVVGNVEDGNTYYKTKGGGTLKVNNVNGGEGVMTVSGGFQLEKTTPLTVKEIYDESSDGNGKTYIIDSEPLMTSQKSVFDILGEHPEFNKFLELLTGSDYIETVHNKVYACGSNNISLFNTYHYTVYVPTNLSIQELQDAGKLPTWVQVETEIDPVKKETMTNQINNFLRYHIQDNSIYQGSGSSEGNYETACNNPETKRFYKLEVNATNNGITLKDLAGNISHVTSDPNLRNLMAREYQYNNKDAAASTEIETSAYAVVHLIDKPLMYSSTQFASQVVSKLKSK